MLPEGGAFRSAGNGGAFLPAGKYKEGEFDESMETMAVGFRMCTVRGGAGAGRGTGGSRSSGRGAALFKNGDPVAVLLYGAD